MTHHILLVIQTLFTAQCSSSSSWFYRLEKLNYNLMNLIDFTVTVVSKMRKLSIPEFYWSQQWDDFRITKKFYFIINRLGTRKSRVGDFSSILRSQYKTGNICVLWIEQKRSELYEIVTLLSSQECFKMNRPSISCLTVTHKQTHSLTHIDINRYLLA